MIKSTFFLVIILLIDLFFRTLMEEMIVRCLNCQISLKMTTIANFTKNTCCHIRTLWERYILISNIGFHTIV